MSSLTFEQAKDEVKRRTSLASLIGESVKLVKKGRDHVGLCPFHGENTPSFHVHDDTMYYKCFGCGVSGDCFTFVMEQDGLSFAEAVRHLAAKCGVELPEDREDPQAAVQRRERRAARERYTDINRRAMAFFERQIADPTAQEYIQRRGLTAETVALFHVGFAPDAWDALSNAIQRSGFSAVRDAVAVGLIEQRRGGDGHYDKFRNRLVFPVRDPRSSKGDVLGFAGRTLSTESDVPKYVNSSESEVFVKGRCLYGLHESKALIRKEERALVVEGQIDVLTLAQAGFPAVAPMGTALTEDQCVLLKRFAQRAILVYDGDGAGRQAAIKAIPLLLHAGVKGHVAFLPSGEDPDTLVREQGREALEALIERGMPLFEAFVEDAVASYDGSAAGKAAVIDRVAPVYALLDSQAERDQGRKRLASLLNTLDGEMDAWLRPHRRREGDPAPASATRTGGKAPIEERNLLGLMLRHPQLIPHWIARATRGSELTHPSVASVVAHLIDVYEEHGSLDMLALHRRLEADGLEAEGRGVELLRSADDPLDAEFERAFVDISEQLIRQAEERSVRAELSKLPADQVLEYAQKQWSGA